MTLADAFARSINTAAVRLVLITGLDKAIAAARDQCPLAAKEASESESTTRGLEEAAPSSNRRNYDVCVQTYSSFRREDCTYQPYDGDARRQCQR